MYQVLRGETKHLPDVEEFIHLLNSLHQHSNKNLSRLFDRQHELVVTRAPGRLDVMGGIADYSGSMVLELPVREATLVALQRDHVPELTVISLSEDANQEPAFEMSLSDFVSAAQPVPYEVARAYFQGDPKHHWAAYVAGAFLVLMHERGIRFAQGARILISSRVPQGKGVSSSAALEVAVMHAIAAAFDIQIEPRDVALLCQKVENLVVGAPCGLMDQMTSACGEAKRLLTMVCQPAELHEPTEVPDDIFLWGVDSGIRHSVAGADYGSVRAGAFMGYRIIAELAGLTISEVTAGGACEIDDPRWGGYLANISPEEFERNYAALLPERLSGAEFLKRYKGTTDRVTKVSPEREYAVRVSTAHPIYEHQRVREFAALLCNYITPSADDGVPTRGAHAGTAIQMLGELMYQSHESYSSCGLNSDGTDLLVELVRQAGPAEGLYGAKITGGGSGGTVAVLGDHSSGPGIIRLAESYAKQSGHQPYLFAGSSPGSATFGHLRLKSV